MIYTDEYINNRVANLTKGQCRYVLQNLQFIPVDVEIFTTHVPYVLKDEYSMKPFCYDISEYDNTEDMEDYIKRLAEEYILPENVSDWSFQYYRATSLRSWGRRLFFTEKDFTQPAWNDPWISHKHHAFMNNSTAIGMETMTETIREYINTALLPLCILNDEALQEYACSPLHEDGYPKYNDVVGKGIETVRHLWEKIGGTWFEAGEGHLFPHSMYFYRLELTIEQREAFFKFFKALAERALAEWPEEYDEWVKDNVFEAYHKSYGSDSWDDDEDEDEDDWEEDEDEEEESEDESSEEEAEETTDNE